MSCSGMKTTLDYGEDTKMTGTYSMTRAALLLGAIVSFIFIGVGCSFGESEGVTIGGRVVAEESNAGNLPDDKSIGALGTTLQDEGDDEEDRLMTNLEGKNQPISDSDPLRTGFYAEEAAEEVLADDVVNLLPGKYAPNLNPVEAEKLRAIQIQKEIDAERQKLKELDESSNDEDGSKKDTPVKEPDTKDSEKEGDQ